MVYRLGADLLILLHLAFILFVVLGSLLLIKWQWIAWLHIPSVMWGALLEFKGWICPLTPLENMLRLTAGGRGYSGGFIGHYLAPLIYPSGLTRSIQVLLGVVIVVVNLLGYSVLVARWTHKRPTKN